MSTTVVLQSRTRLDYRDMKKAGAALPDQLSNTIIR
jgi:hypothetical protein